jgi:hypothetical protein
VLLENLVPPIPSEVALPFAGWQVARGELLAIPAFVAATAGSVAGALILYALALRGGRNTFLATHRFSRVTPRDLDRADERFPPSRRLAGAVRALRAGAAFGRIGAGRHGPHAARAVHGPHDARIGGVERGADERRRRARQRV